MLRLKHPAILLGPALVLVTLLVLVPSVSSPPVYAGAPGCVIEVNTVSDAVAADGVVSLREAISFATDVVEPGAGEVDEISECPGDDDDPGTGRIDLIEFDVATFPLGAGTQILLGDSLPQLSTNGDTVSGARADVTVNGQNSAQSCFYLSSNFNTIANVKVANCQVGVAIGALIFGAGSALPAGVPPTVSNNLVVGNVITGGEVGVYLAGSTEDNTIAGNKIGTNATGESAMPNEIGILVRDANGNRIGPVQQLSSVPQGSPLPIDEGNLISGNTVDGIRVESSAFERIEGNIIGLSAEGIDALPNGRHGIQIEDSYNIFVGNDSPGSGNVISGNAADGIHVEPGEAIPVGSGPEGGILVTSTIVEGNLIGPNLANDEAIGNGGDGVAIDDVAVNEIGGPEPGEGNVIAGNRAGVSLSGEDSSRTDIEGNFIGTNAAGAQTFGNAIGVEIINASENLVGGDDEGEGNVIGGNTQHGVFINGTPAAENRIVGNYIGVMPDSGDPVPNSVHGVRVLSAGTNVIGGPGASEGNVIARNGGDGVSIEAPGGSISTRKAILGNSIYSNGGLGIDLENDGVTLNDPDDDDVGANAWQNYPLLQSAEAVGGATHVIGGLNSAPDTGFNVQFFSNTACDPSGHGEGQRFLGGAVATTEGDGDATFDVFLPAVPAGSYITATATDPLDNTSEFSQCELVTGATDRLWGDIDCDADVDEVDALKGLLHADDVPVDQEEGCPAPGEDVVVEGEDAEWSDWDCDGSAGPFDSLAVLAFVAEVPLDVATGCREIRSTVSVEH